MKFSQFERLDEELRAVNWDNLDEPADILTYVEPTSLFGSYMDVLREVAHEYDSRGSSRLLHPKPTHIKVLVGGSDPNERQGHKIWINDYRFGGEHALLDPCEMGPVIPGASYVENYHTHRHHFVSRRIGEENEQGDGGFTEDRVSPEDIAYAKLYELNALGFWVPPPHKWNPVTRRYGREDIMIVDGQVDIHRVYEAAGAISLMIQGPSQNGYSQLYDTSGIPIRAIPDIPTYMAEHSLLAADRATGRRIAETPPL